jgi:peroxiredoxin
LRILNAEIERGYILGFGDNRPFYPIATDGGLVDRPIPLTRMKLMVGERAELLVDLGKDKPGSKVDLMTYGAGRPFGFPGDEPGRTAPNGSLLNNLDYRLLRINVGKPTDNPITRLPQTLTHNHFWTEADATSRRTLRINGGGRPNKEFAFDNSYYDMHVNNFVVKLGAVEAWTITNDRVFGHSFHVHDVQFKIVSRSSGIVEDYEQGWKDTMYVPRGASATFVARFDDFASDTDPFMLHCHMANHEDGGLMGQFLVSKNPDAIPRDASGKIIFRAQVDHPLTPELIAAAQRQVQTQSPVIEAIDANGHSIVFGGLQQSKPLVLFFIEKECPCSRDAALSMDKLCTAYGSTCVVLGIIDADGASAREWATQVDVHFPLIPDPNLGIVRKYDARRAVYTTLVGPRGKVVKTYPGYSAGLLAELSAAIAQAGGTAVRSFSVDGAPRQYISGCEFPADEVGLR